MKSLHIGEEANKWKWSILPVIFHHKQGEYVWGRRVMMKRAVLKILTSYINNFKSYKLLPLENRCNELLNYYWNMVIFLYVNGTYAGVEERFKRAASEVSIDSCKLCWTNKERLTQFCIPGVVFIKYLCSQNWLTYRIPCS